MVSSFSEHGCHRRGQNSPLRYFHRVPRRTVSSPSPVSPRPSTSDAYGYRGGTRKGLDITFGRGRHVTSYYFPSTSDGSYTGYLSGGVLLRSIRRVSDSRVISGPSLLVDELLQASGASSIADLVRQKWSNDICAFDSSPISSSSKSALLYIKIITMDSAKSIDTCRIYKSPRIGLDLSNPGTQLSPSDLRIQFVSKPYRYFVQPHLLSSNGRGQTFLGVFNDLVSSGIHCDDDIIEELARLTGLKIDTVLRYVNLYRVARESGSLSKFVGSAGKGASASPAKFLQLMGSIRRFISEL